jgi:16S rRNA (adenine1518-N6/adenine1519-N6)-dimethyltransferase
MQAKKALGQHWLNDQDSLEAIVSAADIKPADNVLEIGPGKGSLTSFLEKAKAHIYALEYDADLLLGLQKRFGHLPKERFELMHGDIRTFDFSELPKNYKIVANIPYYLSANLMRRLSETENKPEVASLLLQDEVAERLATTPGSLAFISVATQLFYEVNLGPKIKAELFSPPPKVDSRVVILTKRSEPLFTDIDNDSYLRIAKAGFSQRRKTLLNSLSAGLRINKETIKAACNAAGIEPTRRAQTLSLEEWRKLYSELNP